VPSLRHARRPPAAATALRLSLRQLEAFRAVATLGSVSAAARRLSRTPSAVSTAIAELQERLGARLFERAGRGLRLTERGHGLLPHAAAVLERAAELPALAAGHADVPERLRVGASRTVGPFVVPGLVAELAQRRPRAVVELTVANTASLLARLRRLELDVALVEGDATAPGLVLTHWLHDDLVLFARAGHPLARLAPTLGAAAYRAALREQAWALREPGSGSLETFLRAMAPVIGSPKIGVQVDDPLALRQLAACTDWLGCLSARALGDALARREIVRLPAPGAAVQRALRRRFWIVTLPQHHLGAAARTLVALARDAADRTPDAAIG
jgi:DNA-binding transcriptional LysR family regulator